MKQSFFLLLLMPIFSQLNAQNVGIGTETPAEKLEVNGNLRFSFGSDRVIGITPAPVNTSGNNLTIAAGSTQFYFSATSGGNLELKGGNSNAIGAQAAGHVIISAGLNLRGVQGGIHGDIIFQGGQGGFSNGNVEYARMKGSNGNWGFGTATPSARIDVDGTVKATGFQLTTGAAANKVMVSDVNGVASWGDATYPETDPQVGANTTNYLSKWDGSALVTSGVFENGGNVGIGTNSPAKKLDISGTGGLKVNSTNAGSGTIDWIAGNFGGTAGNRVVMGLLNSTASVGAHNNALNAWADLALNPGGGNVGVGTSAPVNKLSVAGTMDVAVSLGIGLPAPHASLHLANIISNRRIILWEDANNDHQFYGLGVNGNTLRYQVPGTAASHIFYAGANSSNSNELLRIQGNGDVGVGTATPAAMMDVNGDFKLGKTGTVLNQITKATIALPAKVFTANASAGATYALSGAAVGGSVFVSPSSPLPSGLVIAFAFVSSNGNVDVVFCNTLGGNITYPGGINMYITVVN